jgi:hypothetical protein
MYHRSQSAGPPTLYRPVELPCDPFDRPAQGGRKARVGGLAVDGAPGHQSHVDPAPLVYPALGSVNIFDVDGHLADAVGESPQGEVDPLLDELPQSRTQPRVVGNHLQIHVVSLPYI